MRFRLSAVVAALVLLASAATSQAQDFFFKDNDVVVVMGDSITEQRLYSNYLEMWTVTRFPAWKLTFRNVGIGGDRSTGGNSRFKRDVLAYQPTALTVDFGMNDGNYQPFNEKSFAVYMKGLQGIADQAKEAKLRVAWITPQPIEGREPGPQLVGYNKTLEKFSEGVGEIAKKNGGLFCDQFHPYLKVMDKARETNPKLLITGGDAVHPGPPGQALMAASILKGMHFPRHVSSVTIDAVKGSAKAKYAKVTDLDTKKGVCFRRQDAALPYFPPDARSILKWTPLLEDMNDYHLKVVGLKPGKYEVRLGGKVVATLTAEELGKGVNLADAVLKVGPIADQVGNVWKMVKAKTDFFHDKIFRGIVLANPNNIPDLKDAKDPKEREQRRKAMWEDKMSVMPEYDTRIRAALEMRPYDVEIVLAEK